MFHVTIANQWNDLIKSWNIFIQWRLNNGLIWDLRLLCLIMFIICYQKLSYKAWALCGTFLKLFIRHGVLTSARWVGELDELECLHIAAVTDMTYPSGHAAHGVFIQQITNLNYSIPHTDRRRLKVCKCFVADEAEEKSIWVFCGISHSLSME